MLTNLLFFTLCVAIALLVSGAGRHGRSLEPAPARMGPRRARRGIPSPAVARRFRANER